MKAQYLSLFLLIISIFYGTVHCQFFKMSQGEADKLCASELGISEKAIREKLKIDNMEQADDTVKTIFMCLARVYGMVNQNYEFMKDDMVKDIAKGGRESDQNDIALIETCVSNAGTPGEDASWRIFKCIFKDQRVL